MMVQAIENWCCVVGTVGDVDASPPQSKGKSDQVILSIRIDRVAPVESYPVLLHADETPAVRVLVARAQIAGIKPGGRRVSIPVRVAGPNRYLAHPDWTLANGSAMCGPN